MKEVEAVGLDHLLPRSLPLAVPSVIFFLRFWQHKARHRRYLLCANKEGKLPEKWEAGFSQDAKVCERKVRLCLEMKGLCGNVLNADTKAKPTAVVCDVPHVPGELGQCCQSLWRRYNQQQEL